MKCCSFGYLKIRVFCTVCSFSFSCCWTEGLYLGQSLWTLGDYSIFFNSLGFYHLLITWIVFSNCFNYLVSPWEERTQYRWELLVKNMRTRTHSINGITVKQVGRGWKRRGKKEDISTKPKKKIPFPVLGLWHLFSSTFV